MYFLENNMQDNNENKKSIQDKLTTIKYNCDSTTHLVVDQKSVQSAKKKLVLLFVRLVYIALMKVQMKL